MSEADETPSAENPVEVPLARACAHCLTGDVLLFRHRRATTWREWLRPGAWFSWLITVAGRGPYSHAEMVWNDGKHLLAVGMVDGIGGRAASLANLVRRYPGQWDLYSVADGGYDGEKALDAMLTLTDTPYGWWAILRDALLHLPIIRLFLRPDLHDGTGAYAPFCSMAVAAAMEAGGVDPVPNLPNRITEPNDLSRSGRLQYQLTLVPD